MGINDTEFSPVYWTLYTSNNWSLHMAATRQGLCFVGSNHSSIDELKQWVQVRRMGAPLIQDNKRLEPYVQELHEYLMGERQTFSLPIDVTGTSFQMLVWQALTQIPYGITQSYSDIASHIQKPASVRAVGTAIGANPLLITVPCHRVIGKNGSLTGYRGGLDMKTRLLNLEQLNSVTAKGESKEINSL
ncbi:methylated-DNA--[protein]-cysteine S-methyltransferase [Paenibacillus sp. EC2-1]|uniref:methylated-DNA--[protein]-cysteine S-methyltransferase n=1 Tax=Paenibacillus sp. EC2-1 TaxID=3388665 RepID=UPI003BEEEF74